MKRSHAQYQGHDGLPGSVPAHVAVTKARELQGKIYPLSTEFAEDVYEAAKQWSLDALKTHCGRYEQLFQFTIHNDSIFHFVLRKITQLFSPALTPTFPLGIKKWHILRFDLLKLFNTILTLPIIPRFEQSFKRCKLLLSLASLLDKRPFKGPLEEGILFFFSFGSELLEHLRFSLESERNHSARIN